MGIPIIFFNIFMDIPIIIACIFMGITLNYPVFYGDFMKLQKKLLLEQLDQKLGKAFPLIKEPIPEDGWIRTIRKTLNISLTQLGKRMGITPASVREIEIREQGKSITIKKLEEVAQALDCKLVYFLLPIEGSFEKVIEKRARIIAEEIVRRSAHSMELEDQANTEERIKRAINERTTKLIYEMPRYLWD